MNLSLLLVRWNALPQAVRIGAVAGAALLVLLSVTAGIFTHSGRDALFASPLRPEQLTEVEERLASWNVAFAPTADNVVVETRRRSDLLLRLSLSGVPHAHIAGSSETLGTVGALTPQAVIDAQTRDGLAGDIELGLRGVDGVDDARVIIAPAKPAYFADEASRDASASVRLQMRPGVHLSRDAVAGIRSFVAASVPGLDASHVTLLDDRGVALGDGDAGGDDGLALQNSLQSALDTALGTGSSIVRVHLEYDRSAHQIKETRRTPLAELPIASTSDDERYTGEGKRYAHTTQQIDRGSQVREETTDAAAGRIARISAAVFVDATHAADVASVRALVAAAAGIDPRRGDSLTVQAIDFGKTPLPKKDGWWLAYGAIVPLLPTLVVAIAAVLALCICVKPVTQLVRGFAERVSIAQASANVTGLAPTQVRGALQGEPPHTAAAVISALPAATAAAVLDMYPPHERAAIIRRMSRPSSPLIPDAESLIANG